MLALLPDKQIDLFFTVPRRGNVAHQSIREMLDHLCKGEIVAAGTRAEVHLCDHHEQKRGRPPVFVVLVAPTLEIARYPAKLISALAPKRCIGPLLDFPGIGCSPIAVSVC